MYPSTNKSGHCQCKAYLSGTQPLLHFCPWTTGAFVVLKKPPATLTYFLMDSGTERLLASDPGQSNQETLLLGSGFRSRGLASSFLETIKGDQ